MCALYCCVWWCYHHHANICQIHFSCFRCNSNSKQSVSQCSAHARFCCGWGVGADREHCDPVVDHAGVTPCTCSSLKPLGHDYDKGTNLTPISSQNINMVTIFLPFCPFAFFPFCLFVLLSFCLFVFDIRCATSISDALFNLDTSLMRQRNHKVQRSSSVEGCLIRQSNCWLSSWSKCVCSKGPMCTWLCTLCTAKLRSYLL